MRLIDADAYIQYCGDKWIPLNIDAVNAQPTIEERKTGKWLPDKHDMAGYGYFDCSECGANFYDVYDFCPSCGADMREQP